MTQQKRSIVPEIREKIFALYWRQEVLITPHLVYSGNPPQPDHDEWGESELNETNIKGAVKSNFPLWLKDLSSITDEDACEVAKICYPESENWSSKMITAHEGRVIVKQTLLSNEDSFSVFGLNEPFQKLVQVIDFLRSRGYALPAFGFTVEEIVQAGIFKIKEA